MATTPQMPDAQPPNPTLSSLEPQEVHSILSNERRALAITLLADKGQAVELGDLATQVALMEEGSRDADVSKRAEKCVYVSLYQCHIPKLEERELIEVDDEGHIHPTPLLQEVAMADTLATGQVTLLDALKIWLKNR